LYPGFWYTLEASVPQNDCPGDFNSDGDVYGVILPLLQPILVEQIAAAGRDVKVISMGMVMWTEAI